jgi:hypothetical protein
MEKMERNEADKIIRKLCYKSRLEGHDHSRRAICGLDNLKQKPENKDSFICICPIGGHVLCTTK